MIGYLKGQLITINKQEIILNVNDVGYELLVPLRWITQNKKEINKTFIFFIHTAAKDNDLTLIGFPTLSEKIMFARLLKVPSVGPKTALLVLSSYKVQEIEQAVEEQNIDFFLNIKGLAKKTAQKIIIELRTQFKALKKEQETDHKEKFEELVLILRNMGFLHKEIIDILPKIKKNEDIGVQVKQSLKYLGR